MTELEFLNALIREMAYGLNHSDLEKMIINRTVELQTYKQNLPTAEEYFKEVGEQAVKAEQEQRFKDMVEREEWSRKLGF